MADKPTTTEKTPAEQQAEAAAKKVDEATKAAPAKAKVVADRGDLAVAVNLITQTGENGKPEDVLPGTVFKPAAVDVAFLKAHDAIREPTEGELAIYDQIERMKAAAAASADETLG